MKKKTIPASKTQLSIVIATAAIHINKVQNYDLKFSLEKEITETFSNTMKRFNHIKLILGIAALATTCQNTPTGDSMRALIDEAGVKILLSGLAKDIFELIQDDNVRPMSYLHYYKLIQKIYEYNPRFELAIEQERRNVVNRETCRMLDVFTGK